MRWRGGCTSAPRRRVVAGSSKGIDFRLLKDAARYITYREGSLADGCVHTATKYRLWMRGHFIYRDPIVVAQTTLNGFNG